MKLFGMFWFLISAVANAHPVAYQGSTGFMGYYSKGMTDVEINHSLRYWFAPAVQMLRFTEGASSPDYFLGKLNFLLFRKNAEDYQANVYVHGGAGYSRLQERSIFHTGVTADAENRRLYSLVEWNILQNSRFTEQRWWKARVGFAPYIANFDGIHSWVILEANQQSTGNTKVEFVPTLRFFYQNLLWEIGSSLSGEVHLNHIIHF